MTDIIIDANLIAAVILPLPYSDAARRDITAWKQAGYHIMGPALWEYEFTTVLRRAWFHGMVNSEQVAGAIRRVAVLNIKSIPPSESLNRRALAWAERLEQSRAYDAQYLALAEQLGAEFWTGDSRLVNGAHALGLTWVHWVGEGLDGKPGAAGR